MQILKRAALAFAVGGFVANVVAMAVGPGALAWFQTPSLGQALCDCAKLSEEMGAAMVRLQLIAMASGGFVFAIATIIGSLLIDRRRQRSGLDLVRAGPAGPTGP